MPNWYVINFEARAHFELYGAHDMCKGLTILRFLLKTFHL